jgi:hypothetical protein
MMWFGWVLELYGDCVWVSLTPSFLSQGWMEFGNSLNGSVVSSDLK